MDERILRDDLIWCERFRMGGQVLGVDPNQAEGVVFAFVQLDRRDLDPNPRWVDVKELDLTHRSRR